MIALIFYIGFGTIFEYEQPFYNLFLFPVFLIASLILSIIEYTVSVSDSPHNNGNVLTVRMRRSILILVSALLLSAVFPAISLKDLYPVTMAIFHLMILFFAGFSLGAVIVADVIFLSRIGITLSGPNKYIFPFAVLVSLGISYMALHLFRLLTVS